MKRVIKSQEFYFPTENELLKEIQILRQQIEKQDKIIEELTDLVYNLSLILSKI